MVVVYVLFFYFFLGTSYVFKRILFRMGQLFDDWT